MKFLSRKWVKPEDLNPNGSLFGGSLLRWIDEEAAIFTIAVLKSPYVVTKLISEVNFISSARNGDILEMGMEVIKIGKTSVTHRCKVRNIMTRHTIIEIDKMVFVNMDASGLPAPHGVSMKDIESR